MLGLPWLADDAFALAECTLTETHEVGNHALVLGRVTNIECSGGTSPLLYGLRSSPPRLVIRRPAAVRATQSPRR